MLVNVDRLHQFMDDAGCAAIVARSGKNFTYLSGVAYPGTLARHLDFPDTPRDVFCIWPRSGEPVVVTHHAGYAVTVRDGWVKDIEVVEDYVESGTQGVGKVLHRLGLESEKIGFEPGYISATRWAEVERELPKAILFDCSALMDAVRWIKTSQEVALLRRAAEIQDEAHIEVFSSLREGDTERLIHARMIEACMRRGATYVHGILNSSSNPDIYSGEGDHPRARAHTFLEPQNPKERAQ
jgi:Xaa-Pro aminopeptidase